MDSRNKFEEIASRLFDFDILIARTLKLFNKNWPDHVFFLFGNTRLDIFINVGFKF